VYFNVFRLRLFFYVCSVKRWDARLVFGILLRGRRFTWVTRTNSNLFSFIDDIAITTDTCACVGNTLKTRTFVFRYSIFELFRPSRDNNRVAVNMAATGRAFSKLVLVLWRSVRVPKRVSNVCINTRWPAVTHHSGSRRACFFKRPSIFTKTRAIVVHKQTTILRVITLLFCVGVNVSFFLFIFLVVVSNTHALARVYIYICIRYKREIKNDGTEGRQIRLVYVRLQNIDFSSCSE